MTLTLDELLTALPRLRDLGVKRLRFGEVELEFDLEDGHDREILSAPVPVPAAPPRLKAEPRSPWAQAYATPPALGARYGGDHDVDVDPQHGVG